jgi:hypothetical protein
MIDCKKDEDEDRDRDGESEERPSSHHIRQTPEE